MKAIVFRGPNDFGIEEVETPKCPKGGVLIKVDAVGLCGSDVRTFGSGHYKVTPPYVIGHEVAGYIEESDNPEYQVGDKVVANPVIVCNECFYCKNDLSNHCQDLTVIGTNIPGGYAQYVALPAKAATKQFLPKISPDANLDLAPLAETTSSVYSTHEFVGIGDGDTVVIIGAGPLGNLHAAMAKARGAKKVIISEASESRLEMSEERFSDVIDVFVNPTKEELKDVVMKETDGVGADVVITACPVPAVQESAIYLVRPRGKVLLFGGLPADNCHVPFDSNYIHYHEIVLYGGYAYSSDVFAKALDMIVTKKIDASKFVTHKLPLKDVKKGIEAIKTGEAIKVVLKPWED